MKSSSQRWPFLDFLRGIAVFLMIIFHFSYDLKLFRFVHIDFIKDPFWWWFPRVIVFIFLFSMGISLPLTHKNSINWPLFWKRWRKITLFALIISFGSYFLFPKAWIYFGTLHCISVCSLLVLPLIHRPKLSLAIGLSILTPLFFGYRYPWPQLPHQSLDYIPALPWLSIVCLGIFAHSLKIYQFKGGSKFLIYRPFELMGKRSLEIYLLHQPILMAIVWLSYQFTQR